MTTKKHDLIIRNGTVIDQTIGLNAHADVAIDTGRITRVGKIKDVGIIEIDAMGSFVVPGLIDFHMHIAPLCEIGIPGEAVCFASGVTTAIDCGSAGVASYRSHRGVFLGSRLRTCAWLHACSAGLATGKYFENPDPKYFDKLKIADCLRECNELIGMKIRQSADIVGSLGLTPLKATVSIAEDLGVPVMVHCTNPPSGLDALLDLMRPGDVVTHMYHGNGSSIIMDNKVSDSAVAARERGVWFDVANANVHFAFRTARAAIEQGFLPDSISTDLTTRSMYKRPQVFNLLHVMSKFINMGLSFEKVLELCTSKPAAFLKMEDEIGTLRSGACADVAVLSIENAPVVFGDDVGETLIGNSYLKNLLTVRSGDIVFRDAGF